MSQMRSGLHASGLGLEAFQHAAEHAVVGFAFLAAVLQALDDLEQVLAAEGLVEVVLHLHVQGAGGGALVGVAGHHHAQQLGVPGFELAQHFDAVAFLDAHVGHREHELHPLRQLQSLAGGGHADRVVAPVLERDQQGLAELGVVLDDQDGVAHGRRIRRPAGSPPARAGSWLAAPGASYGARAKSTQLFTLA